MPPRPRPPLPKPPPAGAPLGLFGAPPGPRRGPAPAPAPGAPRPGAAGRSVRFGIMPGVGRDPGAPAGRGAPGRGAPGRGPPAPAAGRGPPAPAAGRGPPAPAAGRCCASSRRPGRGMPCDGANGLLPGRGGRSEPRSAPRSVSPRREPMPCEGANGLLPGRGAPPGRAPDGRVVPADGAAGGVAGRGAGRVPSLESSARGVCCAGAGASCAAGAGVLGAAGAGASGAAGAGTEPLENGDAWGAAGAAGAGAAGAAGSAGAGVSGAAWAAPGFGPGEGAEGRFGAGAAAAWEAPAFGKAPRSFFTTGASMVDDAERTNSPSSCSFATASFEVIPSSFASSCTRTLATFLLSRSAPSQARTVYFLLLIPVASASGRSNAERNGLIIVAHSSLGAHRVSMRVLTRFQGGRWVRGVRLDAPGMRGRTLRNGQCPPARGRPC